MCDTEGNPCSPSSGSKFQREVDYTSAGGELRLYRFYNSQGGYDIKLAPGWRHSYSPRMDAPANTLSAALPAGSDVSHDYATPEDACLSGFAEIRATVWGGVLADASAEYVGGGFCRIHKNGATISYFTITGTGGGIAVAPDDLPTHTITRPNGVTHVFENRNGQWISLFDASIKLEPSGADWVLTNADNTRETYNADGRLIAVAKPSGRTIVLAYDLAPGAGGDGNPDTLDRVTDASGRSLSFVYADNAGKPRLTTVSTPDGEITYGYDTQGNLISVSYPDGSGKTYHYENTSFPHHLTGITDENGVRFATWTYDANGKVILSEHAGGAERVTFTYNADGTTTVTGALGDSRTYHFEVQNGTRVVSHVTGDQCSTCGNGFMQSRTYDANGFLSGYTDWNGNQTVLVNNARGLVESRIEAVGTPEERTTTTVWHAGLNLPVQINEPGRATHLVYNSSGQILSHAVTDTLSGKTRTVAYAYRPSGSNGAGLIASVDGPRTDVNDVTSYDYDANDNLISITNALGHVTQITAHDASGRPATIIDPNGIRTDLGYDLRGRLVSVTRAAGSADASTTAIAYDAVGQITRITLGDGSFLDYGYDAARRLTTITDSLGNFIHYTLDAMGNRTKIERKDVNGVLKQTQSRVFDQLSRLTDIIGARNQTTRLVYDNNHNLTGQSDALNRQTNNSYDALDRLIQSTAPDQQQTGFSYDARGNLTSVTDAKGLTTTYTYNGFDEVISQASPDTGATTFSYDKAGNLIRKTDAKGITTQYSYDALNRLTGISYPDSGLNVSYLYDENDAGQHGIGRLTTVMDASGASAYTYDARGNLIQHGWQQAGHGTFIGYAYDAADRILQITYPSGRTVDYIRDTAGQITGVTTTFNGETKTLASNIGYLPFGPVTELTYGNGLNYQASYDLDYQLDSQATDGVQQLDYTQDAVGNISAITDLIDAGRNQSFGYDNLDRLNNAQGNYGTLDYSYDAIGNRLNKATNGNIANYSYASQSNRLQSIIGDITQSYQYDANGNTLDNGQYQFSYGDDNRLHGVSRNGAEIARYTYNYRGQRTSKTVAGVTTYFHYDLNGHLIAETDANGKTLREIIYLEDQPLAYVAPSVSADSDGDGILDSADNCQHHANPRQRDTDGDGYGNRCDADLDNSGFVSFNDLALFKNAFNTSDPDADFDGTGFVSFHDLAIFKELFNQPPGPAGSGQKNSASTSDLYWIHTDHLNTPRALTDSHGQVVWRWQSTPFGLGAPEEDPDGDGNKITFNLRFPGQYYDAETGLHYNWYRYYDPATGRYITSDPIGLNGGLNTYAYVANDPLNYVDPYGLNPATAAEGAAIGFGIGGPPGAVVGGVIGFGLGAWGTYEFWNWYNNENVNDDGGDDSPKQCDEGSQRGNPYHGEPGTWAEHPHGKQDRLYGPDGTPAVDIDYGHDHGQGSPHAHNWDNGIRGPGVPVTVLPK